jgi:hypothetical protein
MSQRKSGYVKEELCRYTTPAWVTEALLPHLPRRHCIWEPAAGRGDMLVPLGRKCELVVASDIAPPSSAIVRGDFLDPTWSTDADFDGVVTNPPYDFAEQFCEQALRRTEPQQGLVAMLLRCDFDSAKRRTHLFRDCPAFAKKITLIKRITWFVEANGKPKASPSFNHAWFVWDHKHQGPATIAYAS